MRIADASNGRCVARGFSIMRLALGYEQALPFLIDHSPTGSQMPHLIGECFPQHNILLFCKEDVIEGADIPNNVEYLGDHGNGHSHDGYLWAFSYVGEEDGGKAHFVIGSPEFSLRFYQVFAINIVSIDTKELGGNHVE